MIKLKLLILEYKLGTKLLTQSLFALLFKLNCKLISNSGQVVYRGFRSKYDYMLFDSKSTNTNRPSAGLLNGLKDSFYN